MSSIVANANAVNRISFKTNNYEALITNLNPPVFAVDRVAKDNLPATGLTYLCPPATHVLCTNGNPIAFASEDGTAGFQGNMIGMCPSFFDKPDLKSAVDLFKRAIPATTPGFSLLHEVQHLSAIVGAANRCGDEVDPAGGGCYTPRW